MKRILIAVLATVSGLVALLSYRTSLEVVLPTAADETTASTTTSPTPTASSSATSSSDTSSDSTSDSSSDSTSSSTTEAAATTGSGYTDGTYVGAAADTRYGAVQVQVTISGGSIVDVTALQYPNSDRKDQQINERAIPILTSEAIEAQSAQISMVSGATYSSQGYIASLQSALDQASA